MQTNQASEFKVNYLSMMDKIATNGEILMVTKIRIPILEIKPFSGKRVTSLLGLHPDLEIHGDLLAPLEENLWEVLK